jgi:uncharacterized protein DUF664
MNRMSQLDAAFLDLEDVGLTRVHHCMADGISGNETHRIMFDESAQPHQGAADNFSPDTYPAVSSDGTVHDAEAVERAWQAWRREVGFAEGFVADAPDLDIIGNDPYRGPVSLRWVLAHMVEEYARRNGHADVLGSRIEQFDEASPSEVGADGPTVVGRSARRCNQGLP